MNSVLLNELIKEYDKKRMIKEQDLHHRIQNLYSRIPRLKELEIEINHASINNAKSMLLTKSVSKEDIDTLNKLKIEKLHLLKKDGKDLSFFSPTYDCIKCMDTRIYRRKSNFNHVHMFKTEII